MPTRKQSTRHDPGSAAPIAPGALEEGGPQVQHQEEEENRTDQKCTLLRKRPTLERATT